ncbi:MAG: 16S rRNA (adenine(1518)-N(6)/adenine(1519)-N(6))-dimethyltransferase RsmA [Chlorobiaceae bacterium]|nr:16S rRNA (adenine(1518)-N(6)/adenine(1519)-N(6))-dimethyltransferase RsmA [Chlorobiaceae bacterium]NTV60900.1 16S rRNA (adenine(1518)-N(6)/adenine(1519)-N(6))-dimethyltransferase RsmA [Chlorobiaceae bacterium]
MTKVEYKHTEIAAKKNLGQNFLLDRNITKKITAASEAAEGDNVLEIGPGFGALTREIAEKCTSFTAVEKDPVLVEFIRREYPQVRVIEADFLKVDLEPLASMKPLKVLGNIPYSITSPILFRLLDNRRHIESATLMMQLEVAERIVARPGTREYGILAVQLQAFFDIAFLFRVGRKVFRPQPKVDSAVIRIVPKASDPASDPDGFRLFVRTAFRQRRKTLHNNLRGKYDTGAVAGDLLKLRAEALSVGELILLFERLVPLG